jgi:hypothetical protein
MDNAAHGEGLGRSGGYRYYVRARRMDARDDSESTQRRFNAVLFGTRRLNSGMKRHE